MRFQVGEIEHWVEMYVSESAHGGKQEKTNPKLTQNGTSCVNHHANGCFRLNGERHHALA